ncbi:MAG: radical SAM protein [Firmicutes bacterium]|nr:radical SAM protein [Bacillota bacterium]
MKRQIRTILPFFIPMEGCPHRCIYCDQSSISGYDHSPSPSQIACAAMENRGGEDAEIAFYGGSFSCLPLERQAAYLDAVQPALAAGCWQGVRISTRPDGVDGAELDFLAAKGVTTIELGIQSFDAGVLRRAGRGYGPEQAVAACRLIRSRGFALGIQLMTGLPGDDREKSLATAAITRSLAPDVIRLYPTVVLAGTPLAEAWRRGDYQPQTVEEAAALAGDMLALFQAADLTVIRLGLNPNPQTEKALLAGPYHPAFGHIVKSRLKYLQARALLQRAAWKKPAVLQYPPADLPLLAGQKNRGLLALRREYPDLRLQEADIERGTLILRWKGGEAVSTYRRFLEDYTAGFPPCPRREADIPN